MSKEDYTHDRLLQFLRQSTIEGILNPAVARSRINAVEQLFCELTAPEEQDIRKIDVDILCTRIHKINDSSIRPEVLSLYNKRAKAALHDYFSWVDNPSAFFSIGGDSLRKISSHLEKMQKDIGHITSGFKKIKTDVYTRKDREIANQEW